MGSAEITVTRQGVKYTTTLSTLSCGSCGIPFAMPTDILDTKMADGSSFWCPNGCKVSYSETEEQRLRKKLAEERAARDREHAARQRAEADAVHQGDQRRAAERQVSAYKGTVTRMKNRAAAGVCQECHRTFPDVAAHMETKHPGYPKSS
jgi:hypothetical protein